MDDISEKLESTIITPETIDERKNSFQALYKNWGRLGNQEERRKEILEVQKTNRNDKIDSFRGILELVREVEEKNIFKPYNRAHYRPSIYVAGFHKASTTYNNVLMLSEWMIEKPTDFDENWYVVPCPKGVRLLVVANQGITRTYTKYGHFKQEFRTALPGGNPCAAVKSRCCVLDCFYSEQKKIMYILDLLAWNNQPMTDGETEFRQYWLKSQLTELPQLTTINKFNKVIFQLLPMVPCNRDSLNKFMLTHPHFEDNIPTLDGLLFYHKKAHYVSGETPLVGWLYPYMVHEVLGSEITIHPHHLKSRPPGYLNQAEFIQVFEAQQEKRKRKRRTSSAMDTSDNKETESKLNPILQTKTDNSSAAAETELMEAEDKPEPAVENMPFQTESKADPIREPNTENAADATGSEVMESDSKPEPVKNSVKLGPVSIDEEEK